MMVLEFSPSFHPLSLFSPKGFILQQPSTWWPPKYRIYKSYGQQSHTFHFPKNSNETSQIEAHWPVLGYRPSPKLGVTVLMKTICTKKYIYVLKVLYVLKSTSLEKMIFQKKIETGFQRKTRGIKTDQAKQQIPLQLVSPIVLPKFYNRLTPYGINR